jgi:hypothetical protein
MKRLKKTRRVRKLKRKKSTRYRGGTDDVPCNNEKSSLPCNLLDKQYTGKLNQVWDTCIRMNDVNNHMIYVTPFNLIIKSIENLQIPEFHVSIQNNTPMPTNIMIEDKYVNCFVYYCGHWYAMMRLFGKTINTGHLARTEKNRAFFRLSNNITIDSIDPSLGTGLINVISHFDIVSNDHKLKTGNSQVIKLRDETVTNINKSNKIYTFNVLQRFRQEKFAANTGKISFLEGLADTVF